MRFPRPTSTARGIVRFFTAAFRARGFNTTAFCLATLGFASTCLHSACFAQELDNLPDSLHATAIGVTRSGTPIQALVDAEDLDVYSPKRRILLVGGLDGSRRTTQAATDWAIQFQRLPSAARRNMTLSAIACGNPDGWSRRLLGGNGAGGNPAVGYPPAGEAYGSTTNPESQYVWRWIGMHAPDLVIELVEGEQTAKVELETRPADSLAVNLGKHAVSGVGTVQACVLAVDSTSKPTWDLLNQLVEALPEQPAAGSARQEMQARLARTPQQVATRLAKVYGHELPTVAYIPAVACLARLRLARLTEDESTLPDLLRITQAYHSGSKPTLTEKSSGSDIAGHILWGEMFDATHDKRYLELARAAADRAFDDKGQPLNAMPTHAEMSDAVFMGCPILAQVGRLTGDGKYFDMCVTHMRFMLKLNLRQDGLHRHSPLDESAWGRGNGFPALGLALALEDMPPTHVGRGEMLQALQAHLSALLPHQDRTGAWHQVVDHPESYRELTSTCMITYAMIRGVRRGWLDRATYEPAIRKAWRAIQARVADDGSLVDVCTGTGKMKSLREYLDRTAILGKDPRGGAMSLLVATEMALWEKELLK